MADPRDDEERMRHVRAGKQIKSARDGHEWTQGELAEKVTQAAGKEVKQRAISKWELGKGRPSMSYVTALEEVLGLDEGILWIAYYPEANFTRRREMADRLHPVNPLDDPVPEGAAGKDVPLDDLIAERDRIEAEIRRRFEGRR